MNLPRGPGAAAAEPAPAEAGDGAGAAFGSTGIDAISTGGRRRFRFGLHAGGRSRAILDRLIAGHQPPDLTLLTLRAGEQGFQPRPDALQVIQPVFLPEPLPHARPEALQLVRLKPRFVSRLPGLLRQHVDRAVNEVEQVPGGDAAKLAPV